MVDWARSSAVKVKVGKRREKIGRHLLEFWWNLIDLCLGHESPFYWPVPIVVGKSFVQKGILKSLRGKQRFEWLEQKAISRRVDDNCRFWNILDIWGTGSAGSDLWIVIHGLVSIIESASEVEKTKLIGNLWNLDNRLFECKIYCTGCLKNRLCSNNKIEVIIFASIKQLRLKIEWIVR